MLGWAQERETAMHQTSGESGSVIVWILIAIVLLAALSFAVSQSMRGDNPGAIGEQVAENLATEIVQAANGIAGAVQTMRIDTCTENQINFDNPVVTGYTNPSAPAGGECDIYSPAGGGLTYLAPRAEWLDPTKAASQYYGRILFTGKTCVPDVAAGTGACSGDATDNEELIMFVPYIKQQICENINAALGIEGIPADTDYPWLETGTNALFTGAFGEGAVLTPGVDGQTAACISSQQRPGYHFYRVLIAR